MNERWLPYQEFPYTNIQEFQTAPPVTPKKLGIEDSRENRLSLDNEQIIIISVPDPQRNSINYFGFYNHPFVSAHLAHFLNAEAPIKVASQDAKGAILADFGMPIRATRPIDNDLAYEKDKELHEDHEGDPEIKVPYMEFVEQGLEQQTNALQNSKYDNLFNQEMQLRIINDRAIEPAFADLLDKYRSDKILGKTREEIFQSLHKTPIDSRFIEFLREQPEFADHPGYETQVELIVPRFLTQLDRSGQKQLIIANAVNAGATVIDPSKKKVYGTRYEDVELKFSGYITEVFDHFGNSIQIRRQKNSQEVFFPYADVKYSFSEELLQSALYAVIAWNKTFDGQRRFLAHHELLDSFPLLNLNWSKRLDAYLGRNLLGYFSPEITDKWHSKIYLSGHPNPQKMMGAQMAVRDSMDSDDYPHARQLLAGTVIQKLEAHALAS